MKRKAELQKDIFRVKKDIQENLKEISFFEDPAQHEKNRQQAKRKIWLIAYDSYIVHSVVGITHHMF